MLPPGLNTPREVKQHYDAVYDELIASGNYVPFLYPWATVGFGVVLLYLLIDHRRSPVLQSFRFPLYGFLCAFSTWCILTNKARSPAASYGVGLCSAWGTLWTGAMMFFNDSQTDFKRLEWADAKAVTSVSTKANGISHRSTANGTSISVPDPSVQENMYASDQVATQGPAQRRGRLFWQSYPRQPIIERLDWMIDLFCNFRGVNWSFQTYGVPPVTSPITLTMEHENPNSQKSTQIQISKTGIQRFISRASLLKYTLIRLLIGALILDIIKTLMHHDAYFWGYMDASPPTWLPPSPILTRSYRLLLSLAGIYTALMEVFRLGPLFFSGILGPKILGLRGEAYSNPPDFYGNFSSVLDKGLAGWWGAWWHQVFRFGFEAPTTRLLQLSNIPKNSETGKTISLLIAFFLSGCLHACGSYTQLGDTHPLKGAFLFFALQPLGISSQMLAARWLEKTGITDQTPKIIRQLTNFLLVLFWLYHTAPLLVDDFAKGGVWLFEPLALSPLRLLGFGAKDDNGYDLWYGLIFWRQGKSWWDTGIAF